MESHHPHDDDKEGEKFDVLSLNPTPLYRSLADLNVRDNGPPAPFGFPTFESVSHVPEYGQYSGFKRETRAEPFSEPLTRSAGVMAMGGSDAALYGQGGRGVHHDEPLDFEGLTPPSLSNKPIAKGLTETPSYSGSPQGKVKGLSVSTITAVIEAPPLQEIPVYVEAYTSFYTRQPAAPLLRLLSEAFARKQIDHELVQQKNKIKAIGFCSGVEYRFHVRLYKAPEALGKCLVEFNRRSGCARQFGLFYRALVASELANVVSAPFKSLPSSPAPVAPKLSPVALNDVPPPPTLSNEPSHVLLDRPTADSLSAMASSECIDVQGEAMRALAAVSTTDHNQKVLIGCKDLLPACTSALNQQGSPSVHWTAVLIDNLLSQANMRGAILQQDGLITALLAVLASPENFLNVDTKRHVARSLSSLAETHAKQLQHANLDSLKFTASHCRDARLQNLAASTLQQLTTAI